MAANGRALPHPQFQLSRWLFLRLVGITYLLAFGSLAPQLLGLVGSDGLLPVASYLERAAEFFGPGAYYQLPTLVWLSASDTTLLALCWAGIILAGLTIAGAAPVLTFPLLWALYLSLTVAGQSFLTFQWDVLLLETGLLTCLYAPLGWWPRLERGAPPSAMIRWLILGLAFKLTFLSGITKLASGDPTWSGLTALTYHYQTQPLPAWTSWYAHHAPVWAHMGAALVTFIIELVVPFGALLPSRFRRTRMTACALMCLLQIGIAVTGNYGFFNLLTVALYISLLDDRMLSRVLPASLRARADAASRPRSPRPWRVVLIAVTPVIALISALALWQEATFRQPQPSWSTAVLRVVRPLRSINGYGLFRSMTTMRPEIVVEASLDGTTWRDYDFHWKPGDVNERPRFVQPHMPRLDWLMWFAALDPAGNEHWLRTLIVKLLDGSPTVTGLLGDSPFPDTRPRYVRLAIDRYAFTERDERSQTGHWWRRELMGYLTESVSRPGP